MTILEPIGFFAKATATTMLLGILFGCIGAGLVCIASYRKETDPGELFTKYENIKSLGLYFLYLCIGMLFLFFNFALVQVWLS